jgi:hypothetical protein
VYAIDGEPAPPSGRSKRSHSWVGEQLALWGSPETVSVGAGTHPVHAWMTIYRSDGQGGVNAVDFRFRCKLDVEVAAGLVRDVSYHPHTRPTPLPPAPRRAVGRLTRRRPCRSAA